MKRYHITDALRAVFGASLSRQAAPAPPPSVPHIPELGLRLVGPAVGPLAAPRGSDHPERGVINGYMYGHGYRAVSCRMHAWWGRERTHARWGTWLGSPAQWVSGSHQSALRPLPVAPTTLTHASYRNACLAMVCGSTRPGACLVVSSNPCWVGHLDGAPLGGGAAGHAVWRCGRSTKRQLYRRMYFS